MGRYGNFDIYHNDTKPYYGNIIGFRKISNRPNKILKVPIIIKDLGDLYLTPNDIDRLENRLKNLNQEDLIDSLQIDGRYMKDPKPYYDPSHQQRENEKKFLLEKLDEFRQNLKFNNTEIIIQEIKIKSQIQNYGNADKEENNKIISGQSHSSTEKYQHGKKL